MRARTGLKAAVGASLVVAMTALALPASAGDDNEAQAGGLEVQVRPAIATPSGVVTIAAELERDDDGNAVEQEDPEDDESSSAPTDVPVQPVATATEGQHSPAGPPAAGVGFSVDFGDGSAVQPMRITKRGGDEVKAFAQHAYAEAGSYTVTVTATPDGATAVSVPVIVQVGGGAARLGGKDRFETAAQLSREDFPTDGEAGAVLLARSDAFADALAAASVAVLEKAPVLLTPTADLPASVLAEISRALGETGTVYLLGGEAAIRPAVADALSRAGYEVVRLAGEDRIATSLELTQFLLTAGVEVDEVVLASSSNFPDALAGAAYAGSAQAPVLLTGRDALDPRVKDLLLSLGKGVEVHVAGGSAAVSDGVLAQLAALGITVERLSGEDRYATAVEIAEALFPAPKAVALATGATFPDALAGAATAGRRDAPVLLVGTTLPESVRDYLAQRAGSIEAVYVLGGEGVVPPAVMAEVQAILGL